MVSSFLRRPVPRFANRDVLYWFGDVAVFSFVVSSVSGYFLLMSYSPSAEFVEWGGGEAPMAYVSVYKTVEFRPLGYLLRQVHIWAAYFMLGAVVLHFLAKLYVGAYRRSGRPWALGVVLGAVVFIQAFLGYTLPLHEVGGFVVEVLGASGRLDLFVKIAAALHIIVLPAAILVLVAAKVGYVAERGVTPPRRRFVEEYECFYPHRVVLAAGAFLYTLAAIFLLSSVFHFSLGEPWRVGGGEPPAYLFQIFGPLGVAVAVTAAVALILASRLSGAASWLAVSFGVVVVFLTAPFVFLPSADPPLCVVSLLAVVPPLLIRRIWAYVAVSVALFFLIGWVPPDLADVEVQKSLAARLSAVLTLWGTYAVVKYMELNTTSCTEDFYEKE